MRPTQEQIQQFETTFKVKFRDFWYPVFGLDVVKLDEQVIKSPPGQAMSHVIRLKYGEPAVNLVRDLFKG